MTQGFRLGMHLPAIAIEKRRRQPERLLDVPSRGLRSTKTSSPSRIHPKRRVAAGRFQESFPQSAGSLPSTPVDVHACDVLQYIWLLHISYVDFTYTIKYKSLFLYVCLCLHLADPKACSYTPFYDNTAGLFTATRARTAVLLSKQAMLELDH